jgi:pilus assembly protein Flp/PilA
MHQTGCPGLGWENQLTGRTQMNTMLLKMYVKFQDLMDREEGQDLVEYALVLALIALGATVAMRTLAAAISTAFSNIATQFSATV